MPTPIKIPHPDDVTAGANLRRIRNLRRVSQEQLADQLGITFQQVQKYEKGTNRLSISRALACCRVLGCAITDLIAGTGEAETSALQLPTISRQAFQMAERFDRISDQRQRRYIAGLVDTLAGPATLIEIEVSGRVDLSGYRFDPGNFGAISDKEAAA
ncbi:MAG: helix-turn-helix transcriptional regulator [Rhizobium sp.]|nr:helix-turn-helix transcriptional regulator [Rhizobium sp.]